MHRLVIVAGPNRGSSFSLIDGENSIGRQMDNHIVLTSSKVSKRHCALLVTPSDVYLRDEGSTNGTFVNGAMAKKQTLKPGDKLGVGEFVFELISSQPAVSTPATAVSNVIPFSHSGHHSTHRVAPQAPIFQAPEPELVAPDDLPGKIAFNFEHKLMPQFYGMMMKSEYRSIVAVIIGVATAIAVVGSVMPTQDLAEQSIRREALIRARVLSRELADRFLPMVAGHTESQIDLSQLESEESVKLVAITNPDLQIIAPQSRLNQLLGGGREASFAVRSAKEFREGREKGLGGFIDESVAIWVEPIKTSDPRQIKSVVSALSIVAIDFSSNQILSGGIGVAYGTGFVIAGIAAVLAYFILIRLSLKPLEVMNDDLDQVLRGEIAKVTHEFKISELNGLWDNVNSAAQRIPKGGADFSADEVMVNWDQEFAPVRAVADASSYGFMGLDSNLTVVSMNAQLEEVSGIRMDSIGQAVSQVARDQAFVSLVNDLKDKVASSPTRSVSDSFEFSGVFYQVIAVAAGTPTQPGFGMVFKKKD